MTARSIHRALGMGGVDAVKHKDTRRDVFDGTRLLSEASRRRTSVQKNKLFPACYTMWPLHFASVTLHSQPSASDAHPKQSGTSWDNLFILVEQSPRLLRPTVTGLA